jgi:hypothetical protein
MEPNQLLFFDIVHALLLSMLSLQPPLIFQVLGNTCTLVPLLVFQSSHMRRRDNFHGKHKLFRLG